MFERNLKSTDNTKRNNENTFFNRGNFLVKQLIGD